jgi:tetratricopeptide (TPR) repeat protein
MAMISCATKAGLDYEAGLRKFEAEQYDEAIKIFEEIAQGGGKYANRARFNMGECYKFQFKWDQAMEQFQMVADSEPSMSYLASEAKNRISQIREGRRDIDRLKIIIGNYPEQAADAMLELGSVYENKLADYGNAIKTYQQLIERFPGTAKAVQAQINIGNIYFYKLYDLTKGWEEFKKVNEKNYPGHMSRVEEVQDLLRETNKLSLEINELLAFTKQAQKRKIPKSGVVTISGYEIYGVLQDQVAQAFLGIGKKFAQLRNYPRAIEAYQMLIDRMPLMLRQVAQARYGIAEIRQSGQGRYFDAIDAYEEYIQKHPTDFRRDEAVYNMAICYETLRNYGKAYENYRSYRDTYPEGKFYKAAELKVRQYEYDEDKDGFPYYRELMEGTKDTDPNDYPA